MDLLEFSVFSLADERDRADLERSGQSRQDSGDGVAHPCQFRLVQLPGQREVEPEFISDIRIAPLRQVRFLPKRQPCGTAFLHFALGRRCAIRIQFGNAFEGQPIQRRHISCWDQRQETAQRGELNAIQANGRGPRRQGGDLVAQILGRHSYGQPERRLQRPVETVLARGCRKLVNAVDRWLSASRAGGDIPAEPRGSERCKGGVVGQMVNSISLKA